MSAPLDIEPEVRSLSRSERLTAALSGACATENDRETRLCYRAIAYDLLKKAEADLAAIRSMLEAHDAEEKRIAGQLQLGGSK